MMRRLVALLGLLAPLYAFAQTPVVRAHFEPSNNIMVGQPARLVVSVFVPNYFTGSPEFPEFEIDNAIVVLPQDRPEHSNTQIGNATYYGITQTYVIYPQQPGDFHVPTVKFSVPYAIAPPKSTTAEVALPALSFHADVPAAARDLPYFLPTTHLTITQHWSRSLNGLHTGDTVERTITVTATKMQAMLIPPFTLEQPEGIRIYNGEPRINDQKNPRGDFIYGQRVQTAKYFIEKPGDYTLPPIELTWWNMITRKQAIAALPVITFSAVAGPDAQSELPPPSVAAARAPEAKTRTRYHALAARLAVIVLTIMAVVVVAWLVREIYPYVATRMEHSKNSEGAHFRSVLHAARANDASLTYSRMLRWSSIVFPGVPLDLVVGPAPELAMAINSLAAAIYSDSKGLGTWSGESLGNQLRSFRQNVLQRREQDYSPRSLAPLNPATKGEMTKGSPR